MKKLFMGISAMFLFFTGSVPAWAQWPEFVWDPNNQFRTAVDDGFGATWIACYWGGEGVLLKRPSNKYPVEYGVRRIYFNQKLKFEDRSLSVEAGVNLAFYGYLTALNKDKSRPPVVYLWVNPETGEIEEVAFLLWLTRNKELLSVPPRNFTLYEDILKKTVKFEVPHGIFDPNTDGYDRTRKPEDGIYYEFDIKFPAPAAGEPDFLALPAEASAQGK